MTSKKTLILFRGCAFAIDTIICTGIAIFISAFFAWNYLLTIIVGMSLLMFRDVFKKSIGKMILGLDIIDSQSKNNASLFQRLLKNITTFLTILEIPILLLGKDHRRLGDVLSKTEPQINKKSSALALFEYFAKSK